jgi:hypothetical protein
MMLRLALLSLFLASSTGTYSLSSELWKVFESRTQHFRACYPASWNYLEGLGGAVDPDVLDLISFPNSQRVKGVVLMPSGAEIQVSRAPGNVQTIKDWVSLDLRDEVAIDEREISIPRTTVNKCEKLRRVTWHSDVSGEGKAFFLYTGFYCSTDTQHFRVLLHNWEGNPNQNQFQTIALKIARSLRTL